MISYIYDGTGRLVSVYDADHAPSNSTTIPPIRCADGVMPLFINGAWIDPTIPIISPDKTVSPVEFKILWTVQERIVITTMKATDPVVADLIGIMDDPRLQTVNLSLQSTQQTVDYLLSKLVEAAVITEADVPIRKAAILSGTFL